MCDYLYIKFNTDYFELYTILDSIKFDKLKSLDLVLKWIFKFALALLGYTYYQSVMKCFYMA